jgi:hypothetical protein
MIVIISLSDEFNAMKIFRKPADSIQPVQEKPAPVVLQLEQYFTQSVDKDNGQMDFTQLPTVIAQLKQWQEFNRMDDKVMKYDVLMWISIFVMIIGGMAAMVGIFVLWCWIFLFFSEFFPVPKQWEEVRSIGAIGVGAMFMLLTMSLILHKNWFNTFFTFVEKLYTRSFKRYGWFRKTVLFLSPLARHEFKKEHQYQAVSQFAQSLDNQILQHAFLSFFKKYRPDMDHPFSLNYEAFYQTIFTAFKNHNYVVALENISLFFRFFNEYIQYEKAQNQGKQADVFSQMNIDDMLATFQQDMNTDEREQNRWIEALLRSSL